MSEDYRTTDLSIFVFQGTHQVRMFVDAQGLPWWVAQDVCGILGLTNVAQALAGHPEDEKNTITIDESIPGNPRHLSMNEPGLYRLIFQSRKPQAEVFRRWVFHEVLPQIRKTGAYVPTGTQPQLPPRQPASRVEVSLHMAQVWRMLRTAQDEWYSNRELALETGVSPRAVRSYRRYWLDLGLLERQETFPRHLYQLAPLAERQQARIWHHLDTCTAILINRAQDEATRKGIAFGYTLASHRRHGWQ